MGKVNLCGIGLSAFLITLVLGGSSSVGVFAQGKKGGPMGKGIGPLVSDQAKRGLHGTDLAAFIHQLKGKGGPGAGNKAGPGKGGKGKGAAGGKGRGVGRGKGAGRGKGRR